MIKKKIGGSFYLPFDRSFTHLRGTPLVAMSRDRSDRIKSSSRLQPEIPEPARTSSSL